MLILGIIRQDCWGGCCVLVTSLGWDWSEKQAGAMPCPEVSCQQSSCRRVRWKMMSPFLPTLLSGRASPLWKTLVEVQTVWGAAAARVPKSCSSAHSFLRLLFGRWIVCSYFAFSPDCGTCHSLICLLACAPCIPCIHPSIHPSIHLFNQLLLSTVWQVTCWG